MAGVAAIAVAGPVMFKLLCTHEYTIKDGSKLCKNPSRTCQQEGNKFLLFSLTLTNSFTHPRSPRLLQTKHTHRRSDGHTWKVLKV